MHILEDLIQKIKLAKGPVVLYTNIKATIVLKNIQKSQTNKNPAKVKKQDRPELQTPKDSIVG